MGARQTILPLFFPRGVVSSRYNFSFSIFQLHLDFVSPLLVQFLHFLIRPGQMTPSPAHWTGRNEAPPPHAMPSQSIQFRLQFGKECYLFTDVPVVPSSCSFWYLAHTRLGLLVFGNDSKVYTVCLSQHTLTSVQLHIVTLVFFTLSYFV